MAYLNGRKIAFSPTLVMSDFTEESARTEFANAIFGSKTSLGNFSIKDASPLIIKVCVKTNAEYGDEDKWSKIYGTVNIFDETKNMMSDQTIGTASITRNADGSLTVSGSNSSGFANFKSAYGSQSTSTIYPAGDYYVPNGVSMFTRNVGSTSSVGRSTSFTATEPFYVYYWQIAVNSQSKISNKNNEIINLPYTFRPYINAGLEDSGYSIYSDPEEIQWIANTGEYEDCVSYLEFELKNEASVICDTDTYQKTVNYVKDTNKVIASLSARITALGG